MLAAAADRDGADALPDVGERHSVTGAQVVLGDRCRGADRHVEAARSTVDALADAEVVLGVEQQHHLRVAIGPCRRDVQGSGAGRDGPVDAAQPVSRAEWPDLGELHPLALPPGPMQSDEPRRSWQGIRGGERVSEG